MRLVISAFIVALLQGQVLGQFLSFDGMEPEQEKTIQLEDTTFNFEFNPINVGDLVKPAETEKLSETLKYELTKKRTCNCPDGCDCGDNCDCDPFEVSAAQCRNGSCRVPRISLGFRAMTPIYQGPVQKRSPVQKGSMGHHSMSSNGPVFPILARWRERRQARMRAFANGCGPIRRWLGCCN